jgi:hypothetical protein
MAADIDPFADLQPVDDLHERLRDHNRRVVRWAGASDRKYRPVLKVLGWAAGTETHSTPRLTMDKLVRLSHEHVRAGRLDKPLAKRTLRRHVGEELEPAPPGGGLNRRAERSPRTAGRLICTGSLIVSAIRRLHQERCAEAGSDVPRYHVCANSWAAITSRG